jgi:predicted alpha-1,2-mannosidase
MTKASPAVLCALLLCIYSAFAQKHKQSTQTAASVPFLPGTPVNTSQVDPFWGCDGGNTFVGATLPFNLLRLGPACAYPVPTSGYQTGKPIVGFTHTNLSGTGGGGRYGNVMITPMVENRNVNHRPSIKISNEYAHPGVYGVTLQRKDGDVRCRLTAGDRVGLHEYIPYTWDNKEYINVALMVDIARSHSRTPRESFVGGSIEMLSNTSLQGKCTFQYGWGTDEPYTIYFYIETEQAFDSYQFWQNDSVWIDKRQSLETSNPSGVGLFFRVKQKTPIRCKTGVSLLSTEQARLNAGNEAGFDFDKVRLKADSIWNRWLKKISLSSPSVEIQHMSATALYHTLIMPTDVSGENPKWKSNEPAFWEHYCFWDVFRTVMPLHNILYPQHQAKIARSLIDIHKNRGWLPDAWIVGQYALKQGGVNSEVFLAELMKKNNRLFDHKAALEAMLHSANAYSDQPKYYGRIPEYQRRHWLPEHVLCGTSRTQEYAYNDFCVAQAAKAAGRKAEADALFERSKGVMELFYDQEKFFWAKDSNGVWKQPFTPEYLRKDHWNGPYFMEGNSWTYSMNVPHLYNELVKRYGGREAMVAFLDRLFDKGKFEMGNEPAFLVPFAYTVAGRPDKTNTRIHEIIRSEWLPGRSGMPGQDDSGALSAWYFWVAMGIYPLAGQDFYFITVPQHLSASFEVDGKQFTIKRIGNKPHIGKLVLNGKTLDRPWLWHHEMAAGGVLEIYTADTYASTLIGLTFPDFN